MSIRMVAKITNKHIDVPAFSTMKVNLAQILNHSVAAGIKPPCTLKHLAEEMRWQVSLKQWATYLIASTVEIDKMHKSTCVPIQIPVATEFPFKAV